MMSQPEVTYNSFLIDFLIAPKYRVGRHVLLVLFFVFVSFNMPYIICSEYLRLSQAERERQERLKREESNQS